MTSILPAFKEFCANEVLARDYDYIVPLESKGILLLNHVLRDRPDAETRVRYLRSFDFEAPDALANKRIALIDDTVVFGRALNQAKAALLARGAQHVDKYACMLRVQHNSTVDLSDVTVAAKVSLTDYDLMLEELSSLTLQQRPTFPDHLAYTVRFAEYHPTQSILLGLRTLGTVCEYRRTGSHVDYSLHYPTFAPALPPNASDTGPNKIRFRISRDEEYLTFSPGYFPSITSPETLLGNDDLVTRIHDALARPWHDETTARLNLYEAFTLALRMRFATNFVEALNRLGLRTTRTDLTAPQMAKYLGLPTAEQIAEIAKELTLPSPSAAMTTVEDFEPIDTIALTTGILRIVKEVYDQHNASTQDHARWESIGLSVEELAKRTQQSKGVVSFAVELLNDYGHIVPMQMIDSRRSERVYRSTELGGRKLATTYGAPDR